MRSNHTEPERDNADRWLLTYADMITLLMAFFIMMYSMSVLNTSKFHQAAFSIRSGFGGLIRGQGKSAMRVKPAPLDSAAAGISWKALKPLVKYMQSNEAKKLGAEIGEDERGVVITLKSTSLLFRPGSAELRPGARPVLDKIAQTIAQTDNLVQIEGHTCDLPPAGSRYPSNWELSTARATNVLRYLLTVKSLEAWRFAAAGCGSARPISYNDTETNRSKNRRVEIVIMRPESAVGSLPKDSPRAIADPNQPALRRKL